jgi:phosphoribosylamine--glycine ligase
MIVIGPEVLLEQGYADELRKKKFLVVGPGKEGAHLETSKIFAKEFMEKAKIPTAAFQIGLYPNEVLKLAKQNTAWPIVLKYDGLAAGKGVVIAANVEEVENFLERVFEQNEFGFPPHRILVEEYIEGREISYIGLCDGKTFVPFTSVSDYKRVGNQNTGPNTGGMGTVSPSQVFNSEIENKIQERIILPFLQQIKKDRIDYRGVLFLGLMIDKNQDPYVLEFNCRFGDPETQALMLRLESSLYDLLKATSTSELSKCEKPSWKNETAVYVVLAAKGYPDKTIVQSPLSGLNELDQNITVFYSSGGRMLGLGATAATKENAREIVYKNLKKITCAGAHYRTDIGE